MPTQSTPINDAGSGSSELVAARAGYQIVVTGFFIVSAAAVNVTFEDGDGTDRTGPLPAGANTVLVAPENPDGWWHHASGQACNLNTSGNIQVSGVLKWHYQKVT